jgi:hypothetical protein
MMMMTTTVDAKVIALGYAINPANLVEATRFLVAAAPRCAKATYAY